MQSYAMTLKLDFATPTDAPRIAEIHMAAFGPNAMLRAQFPSPQVRRALQGSIEQKALEDINDPKTTVLVVKEVHDSDKEAPVTIAFAKWSHPVEQGEDYTEPPWVWPEGTDMGVLDAWTEATEKASNRIIGSDPCYRKYLQVLVCCIPAADFMNYPGLSFIGTDPAYERRGAGSMLVQWAIDQSKVDKIPLYLESTLEAAQFYEKLGFKKEGVISLECVSAETGKLTYSEVAFTFR